MKIDALKRPFRVGGVTKVGDPTPGNGHSAWEGSQKWEIRRRKTAIPRGRGSKTWEIQRRETAIPRGRGHKIYMLATPRSSASGGCCIVGG